MKEQMSVETFWSLVDKSAGPDACWPWKRITRADGRGRIVWNGRDTYVYRIAWELTNGPIPEGMFACHKCDNPSCANPAHIFIGTSRDNLRDASAKRRLFVPARRLGLANNNATLTDAEIAEVRGLYATGRFTHKELADRYGVSASTIGSWTRGETRQASA